MSELLGKTSQNSRTIGAEKRRWEMDRLKPWNNEIDHKFFVTLVL
jgi:hypothetical protein